MCAFYLLIQKEAGLGLVAIYPGAKQSRKKKKKKKKKEPERASSKAIRQFLGKALSDLYQRLKDRKSLANIMQTLREHKCQPKLLYSAKLSITIDGEIKIFHGEN